MVSLCFWTESSFLQYSQVNSRPRTDPVQQHINKVLLKIIQVRKQYLQYTHIIGKLKSHCWGYVRYQTVHNLTKDVTVVRQNECTEETVRLTAYTTTVTFVISTI